MDKTTICVSCQVAYFRERSGIYVKKMFDWNSRIYSVHIADLWKCPRCGHQVIRDFAGPIAVHYDEKAMIRALGLTEKAELYGLVHYWKQVDHQSHALIEIEKRGVPERE